MDVMMGKVGYIDKKGAAFKVIRLFGRESAFEGR